MDANIKFILFLVVICSIWILYEIWIVSKNMKLVYKIIWSFFGIFLSIPTSVIYFFMFKRQKYSLFNK